MRNINILGNLFAKDDRELTDEERRLRASLGIKLPSQMDTKACCYAARTNASNAK